MAEVNENVVNHERIEKSKNKKNRKLSDRSEESIDDLENYIRRSTSERKRPERKGKNYFSTNCIYVSVVSADSPLTFEEALRTNGYDLWNEAMDHEINGLSKNKTWMLVKKPKNKKILDLKWTFTNKPDNRKKARLVVCGFQQTEVLEDVYYPVAKIQTLKLLLAYCCQFEFKILQLDVEIAFLNGNVNSEVHVKQPTGYNDGTERACNWKKRCMDCVEVRERGTNVSMSIYE